MVLKGFCHSGKKGTQSLDTFSSQRLECFFSKIFFFFCGHLVYEASALPLGELCSYGDGNLLIVAKEVVGSDDIPTLSAIRRERESFPWISTKTTGEIFVAFTLGTWNVAFCPCFFPWYRCTLACFGVYTCVPSDYRGTGERGLWKLKFNQESEGPLPFYE